MLETTCPVLSLAIEYDVLAERYSQTNSEEMTQALSHMMAVLAMAAGEITPISREGAGFQMMLMAAEVDTIPAGGTLKSQVEASKRIVKRLAYCSLDGMRDEIKKFPNARAYMLPESLDPRRQ